MLCIHLNRLYGDRKLSTRVLFHRELDLTHFTPAIRARDVTAVDRSCSYRLCSVVCHHGGAVGGHYTCYRQHDRYYKSEHKDGLETANDGEAVGGMDKDEADKGKKRTEGRKEKEEGGEERKEESETRAARSMHDVDKVWVHVSDDEVRRVSWREVASCEAYMLFYEKET